MSAVTYLTYTASFVLGFLLHQVCLAVLQTVLHFLCIHRNIPILSATISCTVHYITNLATLHILVNIFESIPTHPHIVCLVTLTQLLVYGLFGGRPTDILPSRIAYPGSFSRECVLVTNKGVLPSPSMKQQVQRIGERRGCHHCGVYTVEYISDHMPPTSLFSRSETTPVQRLYPQCKPCSLYQGGVLSRGTPLSVFSNRGVVTFRWKPRLGLFWAPYFLLFDYFFDVSRNLGLKDEPRWFW